VYVMDPRSPREKVRETVSVHTPLLSFSIPLFVPHGPLPRTYLALCPGKKNQYRPTYNQ
jgi:hypothetical protein